MRGFVRRYVPSHYRNPLAVARRVLRSGDPAGRYALGLTALGLLVAPVDVLLKFAERRAHARAEPPRKPIVIVVGPPRSGTTLVAQALVDHLPMAGFTNLSVLFPRSPITARRLAGKWLKPARSEHGFHSYYGKTIGLGSHSDALYIWDRWLASDRTRIPTAIGPRERDEMRRFFGAVEALTGRPFVAKNNNLLGCADLVAGVLDTAVFVCLWRDPIFLAQAQLRARRELLGDERQSYGIDDPEVSDRRLDDPVADVCRQVRFLERRMREQQRILGAGRFWIVRYERFCEQPDELIADLGERVIGVEVDRERVRLRLRQLVPSQRITIAPEEFARILATLEPRRADEGAT